MGSGWELGGVGWAGGWGAVHSRLAERTETKLVSRVVFRHLKVAQRLVRRSGLRIGKRPLHMTVATAAGGYSTVSFIF